LLIILLEGSFSTQLVQLLINLLFHEIQHALMQLNSVELRAIIDNLFLFLLLVNLLLFLSENGFKSFNLYLDQIFVLTILLLGYSYLGMYKLILVKFFCFRRAAS
jgi:hypothetical protein